MINDKNPKELYKSRIYGNLNYDFPGIEYLISFWRKQLRCFYIKDSFSEARCHQNFTAAIITAKKITAVNMTKINSEAK